MELMGKMKSLRRRVIMVDDFPPDFDETSGKPQDAPDATSLSLPDLPAETAADTAEPMENTQP
jgi:acyl-CoA dehydrogenase